MGVRPSTRRAMALACALTLAASAASAAGRLPALGADPHGSSVSGLSSGAYMAVQFHLAFSGSLVGAGVVAGGPFHCSEGKPELALHRCMATTEGRPDPVALARFARATAAEGAIDPLANLADDRVYLFGGTVDPVVTPPVVAALQAFYLDVGVPAAQLAAVTGMKAGHTFATASFGNPCDQTTPPFIGSCGYDMAGAILEQIYGELESPPAAASGRLIAFDQSEFLSDPRAHGLDDTGYVYAPKGCAEGRSCRVHVAFHGCLQGRERLGEVYASLTGYNRWADANDLVILYPQAVTTPTNPNGCWDWFAYDDPSFYTKTGRQMAAVKAMLDRLVTVR